MFSWPQGAFDKGFKMGALKPSPACLMKQLLFFSLLGLADRGSHIVDVTVCSCAAPSAVRLAAVSVVPVEARIEITCLREQKTLWHSKKITPGSSGSQILLQPPTNCALRIKAPRSCCSMVSKVTVL